MSYKFREGNVIALFSHFCVVVLLFPKLLSPKKQRKNWQSRMK